MPNEKPMSDEEALRQLQAATPDQLEASLPPPFTGAESFQSDTVLTETAFMSQEDAASFDPRQVMQEDIPQPQREEQQSQDRARAAEPQVEMRDTTSTQEMLQLTREMNDGIQQMVTALDALANPSE